MLSAMPNPLEIRFSVSRPFILAVKVLPANIDAQGHASNVAVLSWMNEAAIAHSAHLGYNAPAYRLLRSMFVVRRHEIDYVRPALEGDELFCATWPSRMEKATAHRRHEIVRKSDGLAIATGLNIWAYVDAESGRPRRIHEEILAAFNPAHFV